MKHILRDVTIDNQLRTLTKPLILDISYQEELDRYIVQEDALNLLTVSDDLNTGLEEIQAEIQTLWNEFVKEDIDKLSQSAITLRDELIKLIGEE